MFHVLWMIVVGFCVGLAARAFMPGADQFGFLTTTLLGIAGSFVGGLLGRLVSRPAPGSKFHPAGCFLSVLGAVALLFLWRYLQ